MAPPTAKLKRKKPLLPSILRLVVENAHKTTLCLIVASILGLLALPLLDRAIRFEEKGLLAGLSHPTVGSSHTTDAADITRIARTAGGAAGFQRPGAAAALSAELRAAGLPDTQLTRPTVSAPGPGPAGGGPPSPSPCRCANVHTRLRAPRGDGLESLALVTPLAFSPQRPDPAYDGHNQTADGAELALRAAAGLVLHLARSAQSAAGAGRDGGGARWLARDLLWVLPDLSCGAHQCLEAWVRQYCGATPPAASEGRQAREASGGAAAAAAASPTRQASSSGSGSGSAGAMVRAGVIQQAVVLEALAGGSYDTPEVLVVGHDGLLPKLDMFYLLRYFFNYPAGVALWRDGLLAGPYRALTARLMGLLPEGVLTARGAEVLHSYVLRLLTGLQFSWSQAVGHPAGPHAAFKACMVDAATVRLITRHPPGRGASSSSAPASETDPQQQRQVALSLSYSLELALRSLNNLAERVHHSPFLYVLTSPDRFVSVERYVGPPVALAAALQLQAAWSMAAAQRALRPPTVAIAAAAAAAAVTGVGSPAVGSPAGATATSSSTGSGIWAPAAARAAARTAVLAAAAAALRALACGCTSPSGLQGGQATEAAGGGAAGTVRPAWAAAAAAVRGVLARPLATPEGLLAVAAVLFAGGAAAVAVAGVAGRLAGAGAGAGGQGAASDGVSGAGSWVAGERGAERRAEGDAAAEAGPGVGGRPAAEREGRVAEGQGEGEGCAGGAARVLPGDGVAAWHAERVVVLTFTVAALTALVCLNWAAAVVAGMYLAPLALWQGWAAGRARQLQARSGRGGSAGGRALGVGVAVVWAAWNPLAYLLLVCAGASATGLGPPTSVFTGTAAGRLCAMSAANYWYAAVVVGSFWLFGVDTGFRA